MVWEPHCSSMGRGEMVFLVFLFLHVEMALSVTWFAYVVFPIQARLAYLNSWALLDKWFVLFEAILCNYIIVAYQQLETAPVSHLLRTLPANSADSKASSPALCKIMKPFTPFDQERVSPLTALHKIYDRLRISTAPFLPSPRWCDSCGLPLLLLNREGFTLKSCLALLLTTQTFTIAMYWHGKATKLFIELE